ncbi:MAG: beta-lactamase family protein [Gammaproteobacteria bacterium]|nr:beta-lactamase family protein [Gammaproteobacteria bacterium]
MKRTVILINLLLISSCIATTIEKEPVQTNTAVNSILHELVKPTEPGIQYVVVNQNSTIFNESFGLANVTTNTSMSSAHTMAAFSMTKTLTAIAILQLVERNEIHLDDSVSDYIDHPYDNAISIRQLISHTSGIPNPTPLTWVHLAEQHSKFNESEALAKVLNENSDLSDSPGAEYQYSNIGYWLLGKLIEKVSGVLYSDYVTQHIFTVLALSREEITFLVKNEDNHAKGYLKKWSFMNFFGRFFIDKDLLGEYEDGWLHIKDVYLNGPSFGGAIGSATAFSKILQDLLSKKSQLLNAQSIELLYSQQVNQAGENLKMTLGWHIGELNGFKYYYKEGGGAGFHSEMRIYPDKAIASVLMVNRTSFNSREILSKIDANFVGIEI